MGEVDERGDVANSGEKEFGITFCVTRFYISLQVKVQT